jgi:hypothetical protein
MAERLIEPDVSPSKTAFIDLEASGLSAASWPIEVGWAFEQGPARALLIKPHVTWSDDAWSLEAEGLHGVTRADLERNGQSPREVAEAVNAALGGFSVWSDAPDWAGFWLFRLMRPLAGAREEAALRRAAQISPRRHRAGPDAKHLQAVYALARRPAPFA